MVSTFNPQLHRSSPVRTSRDTVTWSVGPGTGKSRCRLPALSDHGRRFESWGRKSASGRRTACPFFDSLSYLLTEICTKSDHMRVACVRLQHGYSER